MFPAFPDPIRRALRLLRLHLLAALLLCGPLAAPAAAGGGVALVVINGTYRDLAPVDAGGAADRLSQALTAAGFEVRLLRNATTGELLSELRKMTLAPNPDGAALFYFAGYARQLRERNFVIARNAKPFTPFDFVTQGVDLNSILSALEQGGGRQQLVVLDGAYPEPRLDGLAGLEPGLVEVRPGPRAAVVLGVVPGRVVSPTEGRIAQVANAFAESVADPRRGTGDILAEFVARAERSAGRKLHVALGADAGQPLLAPEAPPQPQPQPQPQPETRPQDPSGPQFVRPETGGQAGQQGETAARPLVSPEEFEATLLFEDRQTIQRALQVLGLYGYAIDGEFGPLTRRAIATFQRLRGYPATGVLSAEQMAQLLQLAGL